MANKRILNYRDLKKFVEGVRALNKKIVLTSGSWDMLHVGHMRYLKAAKSNGDILIVGVDSDEKIRARKGKDRPIVTETERTEMLSHLESVDVIFVKKHTDRPNQLIKTVHPNILVISESTKHELKKYEDVKEFCERLLILEPQAETSTTARIRKLHIGGKRELLENIMKEMPTFMQKFFEN